MQGFKKDREEHAADMKMIMTAKPMTEKAFTVVSKKRVDTRRMLEDARESLHERLIEQGV